MNRWYYRRDMHVSGPFPQQAIERYLILGRLTIDDEVRTDDSSWIRIGECPEFSSVCELILGGDAEKLAAARRFADERSRFRRHDEKGAPEEHRRVERRGQEPEEIRELRIHRAEIFEPPKYRSWMVYILIACLIALVLIALAYFQPVIPFKVRLK